VGLQPAVVQVESEEADPLAAQCSELLMQAPDVFEMRKVRVWCIVPALSSISLFLASPHIAHNAYSITTSNLTPPQISHFKATTPPFHIISISHLLITSPHRCARRWRRAPTPIPSRRSCTKSSTATICCWPLFAAHCAALSRYCTQTHNDAQPRTFSHTFKLSRSHSHSLILSLSYSHSHTLSCSHNVVHTLTLLHSHTHAHSHSHSNSHTHTHTLTLFHALTLSFTLSHTPSPNHPSHLFRLHKAPPPSPQSSKTSCRPYPISACPKYGGRPTLP
jgi:hypothetical protein